MNYSGIIHKYWRYLWYECASTVTLLENMLIKNNEENNEYTMFYDTELKITKDLHTFGEIGILKMINDKIKTKSIILENK